MANPHPLTAVTLFVAFMTLLILLWRWCPSRLKAVKSKRATIIQQASPLLLLPPELSDEIWSYIIPKRVTLSKHHPLPHVPSVAQVCRQMRRETLSIFFDKTIYDFLIRDTDGKFFCDTLKHLRAHRALALADTAVLFWSSCQFQGRIRRHNQETVLLRDGVLCKVRCPNCCGLHYDSR